MNDMSRYGDSDYLQRVFLQTEILKKPVHRIISGYHQLPYILLGHSTNNVKETVEIRGKIHVSPKMIVHPGDQGQTYGDVFGPDHVQETIVTRLFGFLYLKEKSNVFTCEDLTIREYPLPRSEVIDRVLDELARRECIDTGVVSAPDIEVYPISVDKYIQVMLNKELSTGMIR